MAFYVSSASEYTISPEVSSSIVWDGAWHHVIGSYDGARVRLWIDGSQVGAGTPSSMAIDYTGGSRGVYIGTYRGSCDLGFSGSIDDVIVWDDRPPTATGPVIAPVPDTPDPHRHRGRRQQQHHQRQRRARWHQEPAPGLPERDASAARPSRCATRRG